MGGFLNTHKIIPYISSECLEEASPRVVLLKVWSTNPLCVSLGGLLNVKMPGDRGSEVGLHNA